MDMSAAPLSSGQPSGKYANPPAEELHLLKEDFVHPELLEDAEPLEENERRAGRNQSAMDLYLKDPALRRPLLDNEKQRTLFARLSEARTTYSQEITGHPVVLVYLHSLYERISRDEITAEHFSFYAKREAEEVEQMCQLRFLAFLERSSDFRMLYQEALEIVTSIQDATAARTGHANEWHARYRGVLARSSEFVGDLALVRGHFEALSELVKHHVASLRAGENAFVQDSIGALDPSLGLSSDDLEARALRIRRAEQDIERYRTHAIENGLRFVIHVAARYQNQGMDLLDLIQEGNLGLMRAVDRFDHRRGASFPTFAIFWIRKGIEEGLRDKGRIIRLPSDRHYLVGKIKKMTAHLTQVLRREPSAEELAKELHVSPKLVERLLTLAKPPISLHSPLLSEDEGRENELADILADPEARLPSDLVDRRYLAKVLPEMLRALPQDLRETLEMRFGLNGKEELTLKEIGAIIGHAKQAIHVRQLQALKKLRHAAKIKLLQGLEEL
ncbi:MAG: polymerase, sigma 70 subunit, RpoD family [Verrucomicrobiales bacterium]|jgi:RNA polymerase sigma factor (sigma-70 family)|nr:polymerase, sigma 70 subunit, RpoD family [Verrucomicrobiales bacterium]